MNQDLLEKCIKGDKDALAQFVEENMGLVISIVKRFKVPYSKYDDVVQVGAFGLMKAIKNFDTAYQVAFSTYAVPIILGEIKRYFREENAIHIARSIKENYAIFNKQKEKMEQTLQRDVSYQEIANELHVDVYDVIEAFEANQFIYSLDEEVNDSDNKAVCRYDLIPSKEKVDSILLISMKKEIERLPLRDQLFIHYRYTLGYNQSQIAQLFHVSQVQVSRIERRILKELKEKILID